MGPWYIGNCWLVGTGRIITTTHRTVSLNPSGNLNRTDRWPQKPCKSRWLELKQHRKSSATSQSYPCDPSRIRQSPSPRDRKPYLMPCPTLYSQSPAQGASSHIHHVQDSCALRISALFEHSALCTTPTDNTAPLIPQVSTHTTFHTAFLTLQVSIGGLRFGVLSNIPLGNWEGRSRLKPSLIITAEFQKSLKPNNTDLSRRKFPLKLNQPNESFILINS